MKISIKTLTDAGACYPREEIKALFAGRRYVSLRTIMKTDIPMVDRTWVLFALAPDLEHEFIRRVIQYHVDTNPVTHKYDADTVRWLEVGTRPPLFSFISLNGVILDSMDGMWSGGAVISVCGYYEIASVSEAIYKILLEVVKGH